MNFLSFLTLCCHNFLKYGRANYDISDTILYNPRLLSAYFFQCIAKNLAMIVADACYGSYFGLANVCCIEATAKPTLQHRYIHLLIPELKKSDHCHDFKKCDLQIVCFYLLKNLLTVVDHLLLTYHFAVYCDALPKSTDMW
jgi:hypothetical protein